MLSSPAARAFIAALLVSVPASLYSQSSAAPASLESAERTLVNALMLPDADAFRQLIAADAVFQVPAEARGPEAIVEKWRPFLSSREVTMAMTIEGSSTSESGQEGHTLATLAIYGRTNRGMRTTPLGTFTIAWRIEEGRWKIGTLTRGGAETARLVRR